MKVKIKSKSKKNCPVNQCKNLYIIILFLQVAKIILTLLFLDKCADYYFSNDESESSLSSFSFVTKSDGGELVNTSYDKGDSKSSDSDEEESYEMEDDEQTSEDEVSGDEYQYNDLVGIHLNRSLAKILRFQVTPQVSGVSP